MRLSFFVCFSALCFFVCFVDSCVAPQRFSTTESLKCTVPTPSKPKWTAAIPSALRTLPPRFRRFPSTFWALKALNKPVRNLQKEEKERKRMRNNWLFCPPPLFQLPKSLTQLTEKSRPWTMAWERFKTSKTTCLTVPKFIKRVSKFGCPFVRSLLSFFILCSCWKDQFKDSLLVPVPNRPGGRFCGLWSHVLEELLRKATCCLRAEICFSCVHFPISAESVLIINCKKLISLKLGE